MTKEDFLKEAYDNYFGSPNWDNSVAKHNVKWIYPAIDEYAKQEAIEFLKWAVENHSVDCEGFSLSGNKSMGGATKFVNGEELSIGQFYELYLKSKSSPF